MGEYKKDLKACKIGIGKIKIKNIRDVFSWGNRIIDHTYEDPPDGEQSK